MVTTKGPLGFPSVNPTDAAESPTSLYSTDRLTIDSVESPYHSTHPTRNNMANHNYTDAGNPWSDQPSYAVQQNRNVPAILTPGHRNPQSAQKQEQEITRPQETPTFAQTQVPQNTTVDTPRSSLDSQRSRDFWDEDDEEEKEKEKSPERQPAVQPSQPYGDLSQKSKWASEVTSSGPTTVKRKPVPQSPVQSTTDFASNNPFRHDRPSPAGSTDLLMPNNEGSNQQSPSARSSSKPGQAASRLSPKQEYLSRAFSSMSIDTKNTTNPTTESNIQPNELIDTSDPWNTSNQPLASPLHPSAPPPPPPPPPPPAPISQAPRSPPPNQPPLIPASTQAESENNPWSMQAPIAPSPSPIPFAPSQRHVSHSSDTLLDRGQETGVVSLSNELNALPNAASVPVVPHAQSPAYNDTSEIKPPLPSRSLINNQQFSGDDLLDTRDDIPPPKPPRPAVMVTRPSESEVARSAEQRAETYQIKHFNWFDHKSGRLRRSSMLTQNQNGPCPLLALVNALILGAQQESQDTLDQALQAREQVTLGLIIETLMDELLSRGLPSEYADSSGSSLPDVDELNSFLMRLRTGMNANPRFVPPREQPPNLMDARKSVLNMPQSRQAELRVGRFEATTDIKLYGAFAVPLLHGWLPHQGSPAYKAFARSAPTYEDAQAVQFAEEELEYKLNQSGLSDHEQTVYHDIKAIKEFLLSNPTQLTSYGLEVVQESLSPGSFAILFRNDHFSTVYKHPQTGQIFTLITDAGYAERDEIIWESLVDVQGNHNEFFSGDFRPVSHNTDASGSALHQTQSHSALFLDPAGNVIGGPEDDDGNPPMSPQALQEQHDADFAMALQLQEEEEQRQRAEQARRRQSSTAGNNPGRNSPGRNQGRSGRSSHANRSDSPNSRPPIPTRAQRPAVNRPVDANDDDAPPAYEEAARGSPYIPPVSSPLHPTYNASTPSFDTDQQFTGVVSNQPASNATPATGRRQDPRRRSSAYGEMSSNYGSSPYGQTNQQQMPGTYGSRQNLGSAYPGQGRLQQYQQQQQQQQRPDDRECVVM